MLEVKDKILNGNPTYNIIKNEDGTYSIRLATEVIEEGTPLNKKLFNSIMENNIIPTDLDDIEILSDIVTNAGAGWNSVTFREAFSDIPSVTVKPINNSYDIEIKDITETGFLYRFVENYLTGGKLNITTKNGYLVTRVSSSAYDKTITDCTSNINFVTGVTLANSTTEKNTINDTTAQFNYIAVYDGGKE